MPIINGARHATASWPGVVAISSMTAEISHGVSPGRITLNILPQQAPVPLYGDLIFDAGDGQIRLRDCKVAKWRRLQSNGWIDQLVILDRRWKWVDLGQIAAAYNQLDPHSKLIPWTIESPEEIAGLCLDAMGETDYVINLPNGLSSADGTQFATLNPPWLGIRNGSGTNCPVNWEAGTIPPAMALSRFVNQYGCRVIYQWKHDRVLIDKPGVGAPLPSGGVSVASYSPDLAPPALPRGIAVAGSPTRYQMQLGLVAVGEEWDGSYRPIEQLSYAPKSAAKKQIINITFPAPQIGDIYQVFIGPPDLDPLSQIVFETTATTTDGADVATALRIQINTSTDPRVADIKASTDDNVLTLTGLKNAVAFNYLARLENAGPGRGLGILIGIVQAAKAATADWSTTNPSPGGFKNVVATKELTHEDARQLAIRSVFRVYQLADTDADGTGLPIEVPEFGLLSRRQQIVLLPTKVDQVVPTARDLLLRNGAGQPMTVDLYNGYSRDKPAIVYGVAALQTFRNDFHFADLSNLDLMPNLDPWRSNSKPGSPLYVPFSIDPIQQVIHFSTYIYKISASSQIQPADLILETSVHVRDDDTNALTCFAKKRDLPGGRQDTNYLIRKYPDVQREIVGEYVKGNLLGFHVAADDDSDKRANFYLDGMQLQFIPQIAETAEFNGLLPIEMDGAIQQVTWHFDGSGATTVASRNSEHSIFVRNYGDRYRAEFLDSVPYDPRLQGPLNDADLMRGPPRRT